MNDSILFYLNGSPVEIRGEDAFETLSNFLRYRLRKTGTKIVCEEGDCGACSVLAGRAGEDGFRYTAVNSCIQFLFQLGGMHIITVEGLGTSTELHPVQKAMAACHGAQCGYCTPGFVVAMCGLFEKPRTLVEQDVRDGLTGNLCRCTGYEPIIKAALSVDPSNVVPLSTRYPEKEIAQALNGHTSRATRIEAGGRIFFSPVTIEEAVQFKTEHPDTILVQGATDIGVQHNKRGFAPPKIMTLMGISALRTLEVSPQQIVAGASITLSQLEQPFHEAVPSFGRILDLFGAPQIRNAGTLAGNLANASPIADTIPFLFVMEAEIEATGPGGARRIPIEQFYLGYKKLALQPDEIITRVFIPLPADDETIGLYKVSRRKNLDISTLTAAIRLRAGSTLDGVRIAFGGVGPVILRLRGTERMLEGKSATLELFRKAGEHARTEITPISDVRGSAGFRNLLAANVFLKFFHEELAAGEPRIREAR